MSPRLPALDALTVEFCAFVKSVGLGDLGDATEAASNPNLTAEQRAWCSAFVARWESAERRSEVVARFAIGEAADGGTGAVIVCGSQDAGFSVFVDGGALPDGRDEAGFFGQLAAVDALEYAVNVVRQMFADAVVLS